MKVHHRIIGDPPSRGFGNVIGSAGFPSGASWADRTNAMRLPNAVPFELPENTENGLIERHEAYEYQTLKYGRAALIRSVLGISLLNGKYSRHHGYTHIASPSDEREGSVASEYAEPCQLLRYDDFLAIKAFWDMPADKNSYEASEWQPPDAGACAYTWDNGLQEDMHAALVARYWKAATIRAFESRRDLYPVEVCLDAETDCRVLIERAKAFFAAMVIPYLPRPTYNILSMSAAVPKQMIQKFLPTAMVFLYPEKEIAFNEQVFDLRTGRFTSLGDVEAAFAKTLLSGRESPMLSKAFQVYKEETKCPAPDRCAFMADYDVAFAVDRIENGRIDINSSPQDLVKLWRDLTIFLSVRHQINRDFCCKILSPVSERILEQLTSNEGAVLFDEVLLSFLFQEAMLATGNAAKQIVQLICRHQSARLKPFFLSVLPLKALPGQAVPLAGVLGRILDECYVETLPDNSELDALSGPGFIEICKQNPKFADTMAKYVLHALEHHPESEAYMLPLSKVFLKGSERLELSIRLLIKNCPSPPGESALRAIKTALHEFDNDDIRKQLALYFTSYFWSHCDDLNEFLRVTKQIGADMTEALKTILITACDIEHLDHLMYGPMLHCLLAEVLPSAKDTAAVKEAFATYVRAVVENPNLPFDKRFAWLCHVDTHGVLGESKRLELCLHYAPDLMEQMHQPLPKAEFDTIVNLINRVGENIFYQYETQLLEVYENLGDAGAHQVNKLMQYFTNVSGYPYIRSLYLWSLKDLLIQQWQTQQRYWEPLDEVRKRLPKGGIKAEELLDGETQLSARQTLEFFFQAFEAAADFMNELEANSRWEKDGFWNIWMQEIRVGFAGKYPQFISHGCNSLEDIRYLEQVRQSFGGDNVLSGDSKDVQCAKAILDAWEMCLDSIGLNKHRYVKEITKLGVFLSGCNNPEFEQLLGLLKQRFLNPNISALHEYGYCAKVAVGLLCSAWESAENIVDEVLKLVFARDSKTMKNPYALESLQSLQNVTILFHELELYDKRLPETLLAFLRKKSYFIEYTRSLLADKKMLYTYFPWLSPKKSQLLKAPNPYLNSWPAEINQ